MTFKDGYEYHCLNGVRLSKEIVETPADKLDPKLVLKEKNAEVRREIVRKIGVDRLVLSLGGKILDKKNGYELIALDLGDGRTRPYLKMKNPSIDVYHVEGVPPEIDTVTKALAWRNGLTVFTKPEILT